MCVFIIIQTLQPHAEIVNEVSTANDMALLNILTGREREKRGGREMQREADTKARCELEKKVKGRIISFI